MKKLNKREAVAVGAGVVFVAFLLYGGSLMGLFQTNQNQSNIDMNNLPQSGLEVRDISEGSGEVAREGDLVTVHYVGTLADGRVFDSSLDRNQPFSFRLGNGQVIRGWDEGLVGMKEGGVRLLLIAPDYAYGSQAVGTIPADSALIFEVRLLDVEKSSE